MTEQSKQDAVAVVEPPVTSAVPQPPADEQRELVVEDLLVEDVSIDGMCGVY